ncbi:MAG: hypothetical protein JWN04_4511 [Myxococcaceae bacterium]|nr:hypothetical protein [Myxococcaceae bacterium]
MLEKTLEWTRSQVEEAIAAGRQELGPASWNDTAFRVGADLYEATKSEVRSVLAATGEERLTLRWYSSYGRSAGVRT